MKLLHDSQQRYTFLKGFATGPVEFSQRLMAAAARETRYSKGEGGTDYKQLSGPEHYRMPWAQEAVIKYLQQRSAS